MNTITALILQGGLMALLMIIGIIWGFHLAKKKYCKEEVKEAEIVDDFDLKEKAEEECLPKEDNQDMK